ncbi:hypothetical protein [Amphibacillus sediminis]|uniref:hypothetical protein n=1 Tax=Amphibacillus sediminis TaxID=360185 RepID=UPI0008327F2C|nr:hypothetical protein [Amphibacillus sediminis]
MVVFLRSTYDISKDSYDPEKSMMTKLQFQLIQAGINAASSHNMQPWKIKMIDQNTFSLYADLDKHLPVIDPDYKQLLMGQGTFLSTIRNAASQLGVELDIAYHQLDMNQSHPLIATLTTNSDTKSDMDTLSTASIGNSSDKKEINYDELTLLMHDLIPTLEVKWIDKDNLPQFQNYLYHATVIEAEDQDAMEEMLSVFRFTKWEKNKYKYGLSLNNIRPPFRTFVQPIVGITAKWSSFGQSTISSFEQRLEKEEHYLVLTIDNPSPSDYIQVGEVIAQLPQHINGYTLRPAVQILQPLEGMDQLYHSMREVFELKGEVVQIIGFSEKENTYHESVRHRVSDLIIE